MLAEMRAMELIPAIRRRLTELRSEGQRHDPLSSGHRAALWRAQQYAARVDRTLEDLRRYCLESLQSRRLLDERDENDYLRGYRQGFQAVLSDIRTAESGIRRPRHG
jgi:hypothetical protein